MTLFQSLANETKVAVALQDLAQAVMYMAAGDRTRSVIDNMMADSIHSDKKKERDKEEQDYLLEKAEKLLATKRGRDILDNALSVAFSENLIQRGL